MAITGRTEEEIEFGDPLRIEFGERQGGTVVFYKWADVESWASKEVEKWSSLMRPLKNVISPAAMFRRIEHTLQTPAEGVRNLCGAKGQEPTPAQRRKDLENEMEKLAAGSWIYSESKEFSELENLVVIAPYISIGMLMFHSGISPFESIGQYTEHHQAAIVAGFNNQNSANLSVDNIDTARQMLRIDANEAIKKIAAAMSAADGMDQTAKNAVEDFRSVYAEYEKQLEQLRQSYVGEAQLEEPSRHWNSQAQLYKGRYEAAVFYMFAVIAGLVVFGLWGAPEILTKLTKVTDGKFEYSHVAVLVVIAGGAFWVMNIVSKQVNHARLRKADAEFRKTASDTFIALLKDEERPITDSEKQIVLGALFRPPSDDHSGGGDSLTSTNFLAHILNELRGKS